MTTDDLEERIAREKDPETRRALEAALAKRRLRARKLRRVIWLIILAAVAIFLFLRLMSF